ncbi:MAG TPA: S8 family serine peptidase [Acidimicrobiales bacterium]|nr:S8 family serine peptidase [Acidimicrobiales bacterium]
MRRLRGAVVLGGVMACVLLGVQHAGATSDPLWAKQYGPQMIGAPAAWQRSTGQGVKVAVLDTGVDVDHPDLKPNLDLADSHDFSCNDDNPDDEPKNGGGHGTHVSGTIAAVANNGIGVAGVAYNVKLMVERLSLSGGGCNGVVAGLTQITQAVNYAVDHGAKVLNLSLGEGIHIPGLTNTVTQSCESAFSRGALCVVAAGNSGETKSSGYPYDSNFMVVTANDNTGAHASFGQKADTKWGVSAPGVDVLSTWPLDDPNNSTGYNSIQGTSMATPHVVGAAALLFATGLDNKAVAETLVKTAGPPRDSTVEGAGIIHVDRALGFETTETSLGQRAGTGAGTVTRGGNRASAGGGSSAIAPTTTTPPTTQRQGGVSFEEGITKDNSNSLDAIQLKRATKTGASKPFNAAAPLVVLSIVAAIAAMAIFIPRLRSKDAPPLS